MLEAGHDVLIPLWKVVCFVYSTLTLVLVLFVKSSRISLCFQVDNAHSLNVNPPDILLLRSHMDSLRHFTRVLAGKVPGNILSK